MKAIDKFILHVVHNWKNELNEAYSEKAIQGFINKFKEEADDLNIQITDDQLRTYISTFDRIKEKLPSDQRDLTKWSLSRFIRLVTSTKGAEAAEEIDITPDVVYHNDDNTIVIYNGSKEDNCIRYGSGEKWCITRSSFSSYRYSEGRGYPTFYLAKNNNISDSDKLSFVAIQVRDPQKTRESERYVYTNRQNSPYESEPMSFEELMSEVPWLREVPNIKSVLKYIPLSTGEKVTQQYRNNAISYREWAKLPYSVKEQYLVVRKSSSQKFSDIDDEEFVEKHLSKYPELAKFIAETPGIINTDLLLKNLDKFPNQIRRSITANIQSKINTKYLPSETFPFDVKKLLTQLNKWDLKSNERLYVTKDGDTIVRLRLGDNIDIGLYQAEDDFPSIKLNKRTSKYLLDYPELDKIPLKNLLKLSQDEIIDRNLITRVLDNAKNDSNSALIIKPVEDGEIVLDSNSFSSYKVGKDGKITSIPFDNEEVQQVFTDAKDNESFQQNALNLFKSNENIPETIDKDALISVVNAIPYNQRSVQIGDIPAVVLTTGGGTSGSPFFLMPSTINPRQQRTIVDYGYGGRGGSWRGRDTSNNLDSSQWAAYFAYLRNSNQAYDSSGLKTLLGNSGYAMNANSKKGFIASNPPVTTDSQLKPAMNGDTALLINTANPRESFKISDQSGKLVKANIPTALARQLLGQGQPAAGQVAAQVGGVARRGRPAGQPNAPQPAAAPAAGDINVGEVMDETGLQTAFMRMPRADYRRLNAANGSRVDPNGDRGAARRNNILGNRGRVGRVIQLPSGSKIYFIRLANQQVVASINIQPGNRNYLLTGNDNGNIALPLNSPSELLQALQQRGLAEIQNYLVNEYLAANPTHLTEFKQLLRKHINEKNEQK
jgi:hypothetical protein